MRVQALRDALRQAGFTPRQGRGSHEVWSHHDGRQVSLKTNHPGHDASNGLTCKVRRLLGEKK